MRPDVAEIFQECLDETEKMGPTVPLFEQIQAAAILTVACILKEVLERLEAEE